MVGEIQFIFEATEIFPNFLSMILQLYNRQYLCVLRDVIFQKRRENVSMRLSKTAKVRAQFK